MNTATKDPTVTRCSIILGVPEFPKHIGAYPGVMPCPRHGKGQIVEAVGVIPNTNEQLPLYACFMCWKLGAHPLWVQQPPSTHDRMKELALDQKMGDEKVTVN